MATPIANNDFYKATAGEAKQLGFVLNLFGMTIDLNSLLKNDSDSDGDELEIISAGGEAISDGNVTVEGDSGGSFTIYSDGTFYFDSTEGFEYLAAGETAVTSVTYTISDGKGGTSQATVTVTVTGIDGDEAFATADSVQLIQDGTVTDIDILANDTIGAALLAVDGSAENIGQQVAGDKGGLFVIDSQGNASFDPNGEFAYLDAGETTTTSVTYSISSNGKTATSVVTVTVEGTEDMPEALGEFYNVDVGFQGNLGEVWQLEYEDIHFDVDISGLLKNDADPDGSKLTITSVDGVNADANGQFEVVGSAGGVFKILSNGHVDFEATEGLQSLKADEFVETSVTYTVSDESGNTAEAVATVRVGGQVIAVDDHVVFDDFRGNLEFTTLADNDYGTTTISNYDITGTSFQIFNTVFGSIWTAPGLNGHHKTSAQSTSFKYTLEDDQGNTDTASVSIDFSGRMNAFMSGEQVVKDVRLSDGEVYILDLNSVLTGDAGNMLVDDALVNRPNFGELEFSGFTVNDLGNHVYEIIAPDNNFGAIAGGTAEIYYKNVDRSYVEKVLIDFAAFGSDLELATGDRLDLADDDFFTTTEIYVDHFTPSVLLNDDAELTLVDLKPLFDEGITANSSYFRLVGDYFDTHHGKLARAVSSLDFRDGLGAGESELLQFEYTVVDGLGNYDSAILSLQIEGVNSGIVDGNANTNVTIFEDQTVTFDEGLFLQHYYDIDKVDVLGGGGEPDAWGEGLFISNLDTSLLQGELIDHGDGTYTYDPTTALVSLNEGEHVRDSLRFQVTSEDGSYTGLYETWAFTVYGVDDPIV